MYRTNGKASTNGLHSKKDSDIVHNSNGNGKFILPGEPMWDIATLSPSARQHLLSKAGQSELIEKILQLKSKLNAVIFAHNYQVPEIQGLADYVGDSLELSRIGQKVDEPVIVFCGVTFMAESCKILNPIKRVLIPRPDAICPMSMMVSTAMIERMRKEHPNAWVVTYVNTTGEIKAVSDICCTSANALEVCRNVPTDEIIFAPDQSLAHYIARQLPEKRFHFTWGYCPTHHRISADDILARKREYPNAVVLAHPECTEDVLEISDYIGSTSQILKMAKEIEAETFIVATEEALRVRLNQVAPGKEFIMPSNVVVCPTMKKTSLMALYECLLNNGPEITISEDIRQKAVTALERMVAVVAK